MTALTFHRALFAIVLATLLPLDARAADPAIYDPATLAAFPTIVRAANASDYAYRQDEYLSDVIGARLSGSPQAEFGVQYVADRMRELGLKVRLEKVMVPHWVRGLETADIVDWAGRPGAIEQHLAVTALGGSVATPTSGITAPVVVVHDFKELDALGAAVRGKIVLYDVVFDKRLSAAGQGGDAYGAIVAYRGRGPSAAARYGAVATLIRSLGSADYRLPHTGLTGYKKGVPPIPAGALSTEDADLIARLAARGPVTVHVTLTPKTLPDAPSENVIADLTGSTDPEKIVIVSGHLDSWDLGTGATDDGAGVAEAMGVMAVLHDLRLRPRTTIRFIAWMNEENGVRGGTAYAADEKASLPNHLAAIESDSGAASPIGLNTSLSGAAAPFLEPIAESLVANGSPHVTYDAGSETDIGPIAELGVPAYAPQQDDPKYFDYHHTAADTFDKVSPSGITANVAVLATLAYGLADANRQPAREKFGER
ncbi:MAG: M20/M25/M40 family metallo-hydrolase [Candidatus Eremiobacteraeota bacterium]|nr:M20/M25/M40 family metallo-hydrolase [Candidatus Eremiobacteraeota bacterium]